MAKYFRGLRNMNMVDLKNQNRALVCQTMAKIKISKITSKYSGLYINCT